ncbi:hypothetical protein Glove_168g132 [Diversispora epigaea]|uniref:Uncharacterized protein n=1 Tax=Diversispora epigaea TaxID=1348612 RepID=A0A397ISU7_9GLOM|nr:hypothetical protein Glove_168g132 [Diversispora epigaea]
MDVNKKFLRNEKERQDNEVKINFDFVNANNSCRERINDNHQEVDNSFFEIKNGRSEKINKFERKDEEIIDNYKPTNAKSGRERRNDKFEREETLNLEELDLEKNEIEENEEEKENEVVINDNYEYANINKFCREEIEKEGFNGFEFEELTRFQATINMF